MTLAFIPVRGGSKSIPLKNIKSFCGKPLVYWTIKALEDSEEVDKIVVATDSPEIERAVLSFDWKKTIIYRRSAENANDTASTESVMLEYLERVSLMDNDTFMLVQATSPLTESVHFNEALVEYKDSNYDSMLSCVKSLRFFWDKDGHPINYDYRQRPRRQDFDGMFMENGAFYISKVVNILQSKNRISGKIGIYEMPEYTAVEIDEPIDWKILEILKNEQLCKLKNDFSKIKLVLSDVDGVLTDGGMYYSETGDELKRFCTSDGMAFQILREKGIKTGLLTSENTDIVKNRAKKLNLDFCYQGIRNRGKLEAANIICNTLGITLQETAFVGDDINDIELLERVGVAFCPKNAQPEVKLINGIIILETVGGQGVIREMTNKLVKK